MSFQIHALPAEQFATFFAMTDPELEAVNARRMVVEAKPGTPCRVSLADADVGDTVLLLNYRHQPADTPYQATHAIFVRQGAQQARPEAGEIPEAIRSRLISVRSYDDAHMMIGADVYGGDRLASVLAVAFEDERVSYIHLHNAKPGCFAALVTRAG